MRSIQTKLTMMLILVGLAHTCPAGFQTFGDSELQRPTLRGLQGVEVAVERMAPEAERDGLTRSQVQTDVELRLRQAGIRVLSDEERRTTPGRPYLYIRVSTSKRSVGGLHAYSTDVELKQDAWLVRDQDTKAYGATTWQVAGVGSVGGPRIREVREDVLDYVDEFINAYLAVNPEQASGARRSQGPGNLIPETSIIRQVQWQLREAGFEPGQVDGKLVQFHSSSCAIPLAWYPKRLRSYERELLEAIAQKVTWICTRHTNAPRAAAVSNPEGTAPHR
jgi:hypothetical protein